jgi:hypothetical protein
MYVAMVPRSSAWSSQTLKEHVLPIIWSGSLSLCMAFLLLCESIYGIFCLALCALSFLLLHLSYMISS